jgi:hypothetical protein
MRTIAMNARTVRGAAVCLAALGLLAPPRFLAAADTAPQQHDAPAAALPQIADVALAPGGMLHGQVVDSSGAGLAGITVSIRQQNQVVAQATSDATGRFAVAGMPGGIFQMTTEHTGASYRLWAPTTSPPSARPAALLVHDTAVVRGQSKLGKLFSHPIVIAGVIAAAVAIPVTVHAIQVNRDKNNTSS